MDYTIGQKIRKIRELRNYTQLYVARKLGISQERYSYLENHKKSIQPTTLRKISLILGVSVNFIEGFEPDLFITTNNSYKTKFENSLLLGPMISDMSDLIKLLEEVDMKILQVKKKIIEKFPDEREL